MVLNGSQPNTMEGGALQDTGRGRLTVGEVLVVHPSDSSSCRWHEEDLYPSSEAFYVPRTAKGTVYGAAVLGAFIGGAVAGYVLGRPTHSVVIDWTQARCDSL